MTATILLIDDEFNIRELLKRMLELEGFIVFEASNSIEAQNISNEYGNEINVILSDVKLKNDNGIELSKKLKQFSPFAEIVIMTAYGNIRDGVDAIKSGFFEYLTKADETEKILPVVYRAAEKSLLQKRIFELENRLNPRIEFGNIIGESPKLVEAKRLANKVAETDTLVLLVGETGTGKEIFTKAIHSASKRANKPLISVNCATYSKELLESELFGHKVGAFTGAIKEKRGLLEEADGGTIFLDEIGELGIDIQPKLLRFIEDGTFYKIGSTKESKVDVRIIAATNRNLENEVKNGNFRMDLFYRLSVFMIELPSLNERLDDIPKFAEHFVCESCIKMGKNVRSISQEFISELQKHNWKGNIRELRNVIERAIILSDSDSLSIKDLPVGFISTDYNPNEILDLREVEKNHIIKLFRKTNKNKQETAKLLNIGLTTLYRKIEEYKIE